MNFVEFFGDSYFLAWCALWGVFPIVFYSAAIAVLLVNHSTKLIISLVVNFRILIRGYAPKKEKEREDDT